jgi:DNA-binding NtrC family response regulator
MDWPGNVRQLEHAVQMAFALSGERSLLCPNDFVIRQTFRSGRANGFTPPVNGGPTDASVPSAPTVQLPQQGLNFDEVVGAFELSLLDQALNACNGNKARAADLLKIKRTTLLAKLKSLKRPDNAPDRPPTALANSNVLSSGAHHAAREPVALVFDPDSSVRRLIASSLAREGFRVLESASAAETLDLADCWKGRISLFLSPIEATDLAAGCRRVIPDLSVIQFSERQSIPSLPPAQAQAGTRILPRPFSAGDLLEAVKDLNRERGLDLHLDPNVEANADIRREPVITHDFAVVDSGLHMRDMALQDAAI